MEFCQSGKVGTLIFYNTQFKLPRNIANALSLESSVFSSEENMFPHESMGLVCAAETVEIPHQGCTA